MLSQYSLGAVFHIKPTIVSTQVKSIFTDSTFSLVSSQIKLLKSVELIGPMSDTGLLVV